MASRQQKVNQTEEIVKIIIVRKHGRKGKAEVPWFVERVASTPTIASLPPMQRPDNYDHLEGTVCLVISMLCFRNCERNI